MIKQFQMHFQSDCFKTHSQGNKLLSLYYYCILESVECQQFLVQHNLTV